MGSMLTVPVRRFSMAAVLEEQDFLAVEEPLQIRVRVQGADRNLAITMRTPGDDDELVTGFLHGEGLVSKQSDITHIVCDGNVATVTLAEGVDIDLEGAERNFYMTSSCGICGKASIDALHASGCVMASPDSLRLDEAVIRSLPAKLREAQAIFNRTGGLHAAALFTSEGAPICLREDIGRHNAVDKLIGRAFLTGRLPLRDSILMVSGRTSFELLQKAARASISVMAAVGAPSSLAVRTALRFGITLIGFVREDRFNVYSVPNRITRV
jgi:FdhD protein